MRAHGDDQHQVEFRWKEEVVYWEGDRGFVFDGGWGVDPPVTYVPDAQSWDAAVPQWLRGRRDEVLRRLAGSARHVLQPSRTGYSGDPGEREVLRR